MPLIVVAVNSNTDDNYLELKGIMITFCLMAAFVK